MDAKDILSLLPDGQFDPSEVVLIGSHMDPSPSDDGKSLKAKDRDALAKGDMRVRSDFAKMLSFVATPIDSKTTPTMALIYAYGYEGHIYRLPKPRIMILEGRGTSYDATRDANASQPLTGQLYMWRQSKQDQTISIEVESGDLERLVLEANQPGNRAVNSYAAHMQMSHRGGKLS